MTNNESHSLLGGSGTDISKPVTNKKKKLFPQKAMIIIVLKNKIVMSGDGMVDATKNIDGDYQITGHLIIKNNELQTN